MPKINGKDMNLLQVLVFLDDIIVFGKSLEEHEEKLLKVLDRLGEAGLKLSLDKCQFCQPTVKYHGHIQWGYMTVTHNNHFFKSILRTRTSHSTLTASKLALKISLIS